MAGVGLVLHGLRRSRLIIAILVNLIVQIVGEEDLTSCSSVLHGIRVDCFVTGNFEPVRSDKDGEPSLIPGQGISC